MPTTTSPTTSQQEIDAKHGTDDGVVRPDSSVTKTPSPWLHAGQKLARTARRTKLQYLVLLGGILLLTFFYEATPANGIIWCPFRLLTGAECGGCGMTRSWVSLSSGQLTPAVAFNPFGPLLYGMAVLKTGFLSWEVASGRELRFPLWERMRPWAFGILTASLVGFSVYRLSAVL